MHEVSNEPAGLSRAELCWVVLMTLLGCVVRFWQLDRAGLSHFDEGVYVLWGAGPGYPFKEFFAPPLYPLLLRAVFEVLGASDLAAQAVSALFGTLTVPLVWWVARRWYGPVAASFTAPMAAFSGIHIAFSRMALTDATFCFLFVLAIWLFSEMFAASSRANRNESYAKTAVFNVWLRAILAGLATGAAMNTKYNGTLVLVFAGGFLCLSALDRTRRGDLNWRLAIGSFAVAVAIAIALYLPWFVHVQTSFGYGRLLAHHRGYGTGLTHWLENIYELHSEQRSFSGGLGWIGVAVGFAAACGATWPALVRPRGLALLILTVGLALDECAAWLFAPVIMVFLWRPRQPATPLQLVWLMGLILLTPLYRPYARLLLPLVSAGWLVAGGLTARLLEGPRAPKSKARRLGSLIISVILAGLASAATISMIAKHNDGTDTIWPASPTLRPACERLTDAVGAGESLAALARPPVVFYAGSRRQLSLLDPNEGFGSLFSREDKHPRLLLIDLALLRDNPKLRKELDSSRERLHERARLSYRPSMAVLLDDFGPAAMAASSASKLYESYQIVLFEVRPADQ